MNLRQIEFFVTVADTGSFTDAAAELGVGQSTVSAGVRSLENTLGGPLLDRTSRVVELTSLGQRVMPAARDVLDAVGRLRQNGRVGPGLHGRLRVGVITGLEFLDLPDVVARYRSRYPGVDLSLRVHPQGSTGLVAETRLARLDVAVVSTVGPDTVVAHHLMDRSFVLLVPVEHPLASRESVGLEDVVTETFIDMPAGFGVRELIDAEFARRGLRREVALEVPDQATLPAYVRAGLGVAVAHSTGTDSLGVVRVPLDDVPSHPLSVVHRACPPPAVPPMVDMLRIAAAAHQAAGRGEPGEDARGISRSSRQ